MKLKTLHKKISFRSQTQMLKSTRGTLHTRQRPFSTAGALRGNLAFGGHISTRTVIRRLHHHGMRTKTTVMHANRLPPLWYG
jgi:hypothetical protein